MARHVSDTRPGRRRTWLLTVVGLAVLALGSVFAVRSANSNQAADNALAAGSCDEPITVTIAAVPEVQQQVVSAARSLEGRDDGGACAVFNVVASPSAEVAGEVASDDDGRPDLWIPDSSQWVQRADNGQALPAVAVPSIATSPLVVAGTQKAMPSQASWIDLMTNAQPNLLDPFNTGTGSAALLALQAERTKTKTPDAKIASVLVPLAQRQGSLARPYTDPIGLLSRAEASETPVVVPVSEQAYVAYRERRPDTALRAVVPATGTLGLDYPIVVTGDDKDGKILEAGKRLGQELRTDAQARGLDQAGFRSPTGDPLSSGRGVGDVAQLGKPDAKVAATVLQKWATLALSAHALAVIDASSSMLTQVGGGKTWMDLTAEAAEEGMRLFPDNSQIGLWALSTKFSGINRDWYPLVPIRRLDAKVANRTQRVELVGQLRGLKTKIGGSTGLYDAVLAAYRTVQDSYDPRSVNSILVFTDGFSTNVRGLTLESTLTSLQQLRDPARPVRLIAIGMGPDVDITSLNKLARATGGRAYQAREPDDIKRVFVDALQNR